MTFLNMVQQTCRSFAGLLPLLWFLFPLTGNAQSEKEAAKAFATGNYFESTRIYESLLSHQPDNKLYNYYTGIGYLRTNISPKAALPYLQKAAVEPVEDVEVFLYLAQAYMQNLLYNEALESLQKLKDSGGVTKKNKVMVDQMIRNCTAAKDLLQYPLDVEFIHLGPEVNSPYPDYHPYIAKDEQNLIFTTRRKIIPNSMPEFDGYYPSDIFEAVMTDSSISMAASISDRINTAYDEQCVGLSDGGDTIYIYIDHINEFGDIYYSVRNNAVFSAVQRVDEPGVNSIHIETSYSISPDGNTVLFASNREGSAGGFDIWMLRRLPDGKWGEPQNMGTEINTALDEGFPTFSGDGKTLYFCSEGHAGMGGFDIYYSIWDPVFNIWTKPANIGYPLNTPEDNKTISFTENGTYAYIDAVREEGLGDKDIYKVRFNNKYFVPAVFRAMVQGIDGQPLQPEIRIKNEYDELIGQYLPSHENGKYVFALYPGKYIVYIDAEGYAPYNEILIVSEFHTSKDQNIKTIILSK